MSLESPTPSPKNNPPPSLSEIFNREVNRALNDYPHLQGTFALVNTVDKEVIGDIDPKKTGFRSEKHLHRHLMEAAHASHQHGPLSQKDTRSNLNIIAYSPVPFRLFTREKDPMEVEVLAIFDHELGHIVVNGAFESLDPCYRECAADAFAVLRHMQRYGTNTDLIAIGGWRRAYDFVMSGDAGHFTTLAIEEINHLKDKIDFKAMTPQQMVHLATRIALEHTPHADTTNAMAMIFDPFRRALHKTQDMAKALETLAGIALANKHDYHVFKIAHCVLSTFLDGKARNDNGPLILSGPFWDQARIDLKTHADSLKAHGILMGMPVVPPKAPPSTGTQFRPAA